MPKVSVMMCVHNAEEYIKDCLDSIFCQSFGDFELVVVDDGSTDSTMEQVKLCSDNRIRIIQKEHDYIGSLNAGLDACTGEYIARMDADDLMHPDRLQVQVALMDSEPSCCPLCLLGQAFWRRGIAFSKMGCSFWGVCEASIC